MTVQTERPRDFAECRSRCRSGATAFRERRVALRRPRRGDQHHPPPAAGARRRGRAPRPQPQRRRHRPRRDPGGRGRHRLQLVPGRSQRILPLHGRHARASTAPVTSASWSAAAARSRRTEIAELAGLRRRAHLHARGRPQARARRHDRGRARARASLPASRRSSSAPSARATTSRSRARSPRSSRTRTDRGARRDAAQAAARRHAQVARRRHHGHRRRRQVEPDRRTADALRALLSGSQHRRRRDGPDAPPQRRRPARRPHPHELARRGADLHALARDAARSTSRRAPCWPTCSTCSSTRAST